jgi:hypothetical protein
MIDLLRLTASEAERIAYSQNFALAAELFTRIVDLEAERDQLANELAAAADDSLKLWENEYGNADEYRKFFFDCFTRLTDHYPAPDVSSDYDKSVIFAAIEKGEEAPQLEHIAER